MSSLALVERADERLTALARLEALCDPGSLQLLRTQVRSRRMGEKARDGDGILGASGRVDGRAVFCYAQDPSFAGGAPRPAPPPTPLPPPEPGGPRRGPPARR